MKVLTKDPNVHWEIHSNHVFDEHMISVEDFKILAEHFLDNAHDYSRFSSKVELVMNDLPTKVRVVLKFQSLQILDSMYRNVNHRLCLI